MRLVRVSSRLVHQWSFDQEPFPAHASSPDGHPCPTDIHRIFHLGRRQAQRPPGELLLASLRWPNKNSKWLSGVSPRVKRNLLAPGAHEHRRGPAIGTACLLMDASEIKGQNDSTRPTLGPAFTPDQKGDAGHSRHRRSTCKFEEEAAPASFLQLFKYSSFKDRSFTAVGCVVAVVTGFAMPTLIILMGQLLRKFIIFHSVIDQLCSNSTSAPVPYMYQTTDDNETLTIEQFQLDAKLISGHMALVGLAMLLSNVVIVGSLGMSATKQSFRIRHNFMRAMLHQEVGWFDTHTAGDFARRITADLGNIHDGLGENIGMCLFFLSTASTSLVSAFWHGWHLTLALLAMLPLLVLVTALIAKIQAKLEAKESVAYQDAGTVAEEAVSFIKNVIAYGGERKEMKRHVGHP
ncbi:hypothetical protein HPB47_026669 [Ixodes persulcatus]|uniref:Uncharacterized protein n=1 Tax=Ixodes persulcatus TaxID=34615 RepID=A0AC60PY15_IXOPE|nr:hypothetical protein HPB47_026669 [Ixodes persulcatus]